MRALETTAVLATFERRGPGTDAERRTARRLARELYTSGYKVRTETFWCRPNWALAHAWHVALALAGSLLSVSEPTLGAAMLGAAVLCTLSDGLFGVSPGRRLTPEHASQNVVATATGGPDKPTDLIITANYDAGRTALIYRDALRRPAAWLKRTLGPLALGWIAWLSLAMTWSLAIAVIRATERHPPHDALGAIQLPPTVALVLALALLLEAAAAGYGSAANDNASGTAVAIAITDALKTSPPTNLNVQLVLQGAGEGQEIGLRRYLRTHKTELTRQGTIVLGIAPCGAGRVTQWLSDGRLIPLGYARRLRDVRADIDGIRGRGGTPALPARARGLAATTIGCLDARGLPARSHQPTDTVDMVDASALDRALEQALVLVDEINASLKPAEPAATPA